MSYKLNHTAEAIDYKLNLIEKNKNLLPYPYVTTLPDGFEDVGDGSILTYAPAGATETSFLLNTCILPAGEYTVSLNITDLTEKPVNNVHFSLEIKSADITIATALANEVINDGSTFRFDLDTETTVKIYLNAPASFDANLLIKPQIEEGLEMTAWVPYMDKIGTYVDERFNSTNVKIKVLVDRLETLVNRLETIESALSAGVVLLGEKDS